MTLSSRSPQRVGVFGGAFDPPHVAHMALAQTALKQFNLNRLIVLPTGQAWHKDRSLSASAHRLAMSQLAFAGLSQAQVDDREICRIGPTYTIDTLQQLQAENPGDQLFLIVGTDQACALTGWHRWQALLQIAIICVAVRAAERGTAAAQRWVGDKPLDIAGLVAGLPKPLRTQGRFELLHLPPMGVSATDIRQRVATGLGIADLVTEPVARYIAQNHLYLSN